MQPELIMYRKFNDPALAANLVEILEKHEINFRVEEISAHSNPLVTLINEHNKDYLVLIAPADFTLANQVLNEAEKAEVDMVDNDHYLFAFSNDELLDILAKADEWSPFDYQLARKILIGRGVDISDERLSALTQQRIVALKVTEPPQTFWIIMGYIFALLGGVLGIFIGWHLSTYKKTLPNGEKVFDYSEADRRHGKLILYLSIIGISLSFIYQIRRVSS